MSVVVSNRPPRNIHTTTGEILLHKILQARIARHSRHVAYHKHQRRIAVVLGMLHDPLRGSLERLVEARGEFLAGKFVEGIVVIQYSRGP